MNAKQLERLIHNGAFGVNLFYCMQDITPGFNAFFAAMPVRGYEYECGTIQWHRDVLPALNRWVKERTGKTLMKVVTSNDGMTEQEVLPMLRNRAKGGKGGNDRVWLVFAWEPNYKTGYRGRFEEVDFDV